MCPERQRENDDLEVLVSSATRFTFLSEPHHPSSKTQRARGRGLLFCDPFRVAQNDFLEYVHNYDHYYGTSRRPLEKALRQGQTVILDLETEGVARVKDLYPTSLSIFILPPSLQALKDRLYGRGDESPVQLKLRMAQVAQQFGQASQFDFILLNDDQTHAQAQLSELIKALETHDKDRVDEMSRATQAYQPLLKTLHDEALTSHEGTKDS